MELYHFNQLDREEALSLLLLCCGSRGWAAMMVELRPFLDVEEVVTMAERVWWKREVEDWLAAFSSQPDMADPPAADDPNRLSWEWAVEERSAMHDSDPDRLGILTDAIRAYEVRFGYPCVAFTRGRSAEEILESLTARLDHDTGTELRVAATEQVRLAQDRLARLLGEPEAYARVVGP